MLHIVPRKQPSVLFTFQVRNIFMYVQRPCGGGGLVCVEIGPLLPPVLESCKGTTQSRRDERSRGRFRGGGSSRVANSFGRRWVHNK